MQSPPPPSQRTPQQKEAAKKWASLMMIGGLGVIGLAVTWGFWSVARRRAHLRGLQKDWKSRREGEVDAWREAGKRMESPSASDLEGPGKRPDGGEDGPSGRGEDSGGGGEGRRS